MSRLQAFRLIGATIVALLCPLVGPAACHADNALSNSQSGLDWSLAARAPINFSFADGLKGWYVGHEAAGYRLTHQRHGFRGKPCVELAATHPADDGWECIVQNLCAVNYRGKRVRLSAWMKTEQVDSVAMGLRLDSVSAVATVQNEEVSGTTPWRKYVLVFDVPADAQGFAIAPGNLTNHGKLWLADVRLDIVDKATATVGRVLKWADYAGDTERVVHTWKLCRRGRPEEALSELEWIADDPQAGKEERCTALEGVAAVSLILGKRDAAAKALDQFDAMRTGLKIDPGVVAEGARDRATLSGSPAAASITRWQNANGNDWRTTAQTPRNLSFHAGLGSWWKGSETGDAADYGAGVQARRDVGYVAFIRSVVSSPRGSVFLDQALRADHYLGKRVRISALLRVSGHPETAGLFAHRDTVRDYSAWLVAPEPARAGGWSRCAVVLDMPQDGQGLFYGVTLSGRGTVWLSDVRVEVVPPDTPITPPVLTR